MVNNYLLGKLFQGRKLDIHDEEIVKEKESQPDKAVGISAFEKDYGDGIDSATKLENGATINDVLGLLIAGKQQGYHVEKLLEYAKKENIEIKKDPDLLEILFAIDIGEEIPLVAFEVIFEILIQIYTQNNK